MSVNDDSLMEADIEDKDYRRRIKEVISQTLQKAFELKELERFLDQIVKVGSEKADAKACSIFLLDEDDKTLRVYAASGKVGETLKSRKAEYYVPERPAFTEKGTGKQKVEEYLQKRGYDEERLRKENKSLTDVIKDSGDDLRDLVEKGELPMGITAWVVKMGDEIEEPVCLHGKEVRDHPEWRGAYEGAHEICTSLIEIPLKVSNKGTVGMIKIENHQRSLSLHNFKDLDNPEICRKVYPFTGQHGEILNILANSATLAIEYVLYKEDTYKKLFGTTILSKISQLEISNPTVNGQVYSKLKEFYDRIRVKIEDIGGIDEIFKGTTVLITEIAQILDLHGVLEIIDNIGPAFEALLGTDVHYREHFIHQFQVFLLGYYLINRKEALRKSLINYLRKRSDRYDNVSDDGMLVDILRIWFLASIFHDFAYSVGKMENWLESYSTRVKVPSKFQINWGDMYSHYEAEKMKLCQLLSPSTGRGESEIAALTRKAFIEWHDHGAIGALMLMNILQNKVDEIILREASCGILLHSETVYSQFDTLKMSLFPFAFLLVFCDTAQQWGRPRMATLTQDVNVMLEDIVTDDCRKVEVVIRFGKLSDEQTREIKKFTSLPTQYWCSENIEFSIYLYEKEKKRPFGHYWFRKA